jgi:hypothetical protein
MGGLSGGKKVASIKSLSQVLKVWEVGEGERERERPSLKSVLSG